MEGESGITGCIMDELHSSDIGGYEMEHEGTVTRSIVDELLLRISNEIKWKVKMVLLEGTLMKFILWISKKIK